MWDTCKGVSLCLLFLVLVFYMCSYVSRLGCQCVVPLGPPDVSVFIPRMCLT